MPHCLLIQSTFALCFEGDSHKQSTRGESRAGAIMITALSLKEETIF